MMRLTTGLLLLTLLAYSQALTPQPTAALHGGAGQCTIAAAPSPLIVPVPPELEGNDAAPHQPRQLCAPTGPASGDGWNCSNWAGSVTWEPASLVVPASEEELSSYLRASAAAAAAPGAPPRRPLKVVGFAHSWAGLYVPSAGGDTLALHRLTGITRLSDGTVEVLAGTSFARLFAELDSRALALAWAPGGIQGLTVGGAVAVGFHGSQLSLGGVSSVVSALRVMDTDGNVHELSDETDPEGMRAARMGLGVCGIVTRVTLPVVPQFHLRRRRWRVNDTQAFLTQQLSGLKAEYDRFHWYAHPATGTAWPMLWEPATEADSAAEARPCRTALEQHEDAAEKEFGRDGLPLIMRWDNCSDASHRSLTHAVDMEAQPLWNGEYYVALDDAGEAAASADILAAFQRVAAERGEDAVSLHLWLHVRYVGGDEQSLLNPCYGSAACAAFELALVAPAMDAPLPPWEEWAAYFGAMEDVLRALGGRPHHAKYRSPPLPGTAGLGLPVEQFWSQCKRFDPEHLMRSQAVEELLGASPAS